MKKKIEIRETGNANYTIREIEREDGTVEQTRVITGTAIVFNRESQVLDEYGERFVEIIKPEAATKEFLRSQDIKLNLLHDRDTTFARSNHGKGNLKLTVDNEGVKFEVEVPKCDLGDRALELVRAGVYSGCSFEFYPKDYQISERETADGKQTVITHTAFESISALTIALDPAYLQTSVSARELADKTPQAQERREKAEKHRQRELEIAKAQDFLRRQELENITFNL